MPVTPEKIHADKKTKEVQEQAKVKEKKAALIVAFKTASNEILDTFNGLIPNVTIEDAGGFFQVKVIIINSLSFSVSVKHN